MIPSNLTNSMLPTNFAWARDGRRLSASFSRTKSLQDGESGRRDSTLVDVDENDQFSAVKQENFEVVIAHIRALMGYYTHLEGRLKKLT